MIRYCLIIVAAFLLSSPVAAQIPRAGGSGDTDYCASCHEALKGKAQAPVSQWRASVHAGKGRKCSICHGGDSSVNDRFRAKTREAKYIGKPDRRAVSEFCGRGECHAEALAQFKRGPHFQTARRIGEPSCSSCHGVHDVRRSSGGIINEKSCAACHPAEKAVEFAKTVSEIERGFTEVDRTIAFLKEKRAETETFEKRLRDVRSMYRQLVHIFSAHEMEFTVRLIKTEMASLNAETASKAGLVRRLDLLYLIMFGLGMAIIAWVLLYTAITYARRKR